MFKKRTLKNTSTTRRRDEADTANEDLEISSFAKEQPSKKPKLESSAVRDIDYTKSIKRNFANDPSLTHLENTTEITSEIETKPKIVGPKAAPKNVRVTTLTDFQPDVCKDFQQTGYCGYGDTCKFLHIRDESRQKKPIEKEWETVNIGNDTPDSKNNVTGGIPFKCLICRNDYQKPVKTSCGHIFCQECFMRRFKKEKKRKCIICRKDTGGAVQPVKDILAVTEQDKSEEK